MPSQPPFRRVSRSGFTIVELLIVLGVLAVVAAVALPAMEPAEPYELDRLSLEVADAARYARAEAMRMSADYGVSISASEVRVFRVAPGSSPPVPVYDVYHPISKKLYVVDLTRASTRDSIALGGTVNYETTCNTPFLIGFDSHGTPRCGNPWSVPLTATALIFSTGGHERTLVIDGVLGRVRVL